MEEEEEETNGESVWMNGFQLLALPDHGAKTLWRVDPPIIITIYDFSTVKAI